MTTNQPSESNWEIRNGNEVWSKALNERVFTSATPVMAEWISNWAMYFHPMNNLFQVSSEIERYVAGRFAIPKELRRQFAEAVERVRAVRGDPDEEPEDDD